MSDQVLAIRRSLRRHLLLGLSAVSFVFVGAGGWAVSTELAGAVIAEGQLVVESTKKTIQSPNAGVVAEIRVDDGTHVKAGDLLVRLDDTEARSNLAIVQRQIDELSARQAARLQAEVEGIDAVAFPEELTARAADPSIAKVLSGETSLFNSRRGTREAQKSQLRQQVDQLSEQINGLSVQVAGKQQEITFNSNELDKLQDLAKQHLTIASNVTKASMDGARLSGELGALQASIASARGKVSETELRIIQVDEDLRSSAGSDLADVRSNLAQLQEKRVAAQEQLSRVEIRAPQDGTITELAFHTVRGVVSASQPLMALVPDADGLAVDVRVRPQDIDQLHLGQFATLRFEAFSQRTTPELDGEVTRVSADVVQDQRTNASYYAVRIALADGETAKLNGAKLVPGMPVEAFVQTTPRTAMAYLAKPFVDQFNRAFREK